MSSQRRTQRFYRLSGLEFETYCAGLLKRCGYKNVTLTGGSGDQGIDIIATKHRKTYGIQCKKYDGRVGNKAVQQAYAGCTYYGLDYAVVLTNSYFTRSAYELAEETDVLLWDRDILLRLKKPARIWGILSGLLLSAIVIGTVFLLVYTMMH